MLIRIINLTLLSGCQPNLGILSLPTILTTMIYKDYHTTDLVGDLIACMFGYLISALFAAKGVSNTKVKRVS